MLKVKVFATNASIAPSNGQVDVIRWDQRQRMHRALKWGGGCFGLAVVSIALPIVHFFLVPGFLLATPFIAAFIHQQASMVQGGEFTCPYCQKMSAVAKGKELWPLTDQCGHCSKTVRMELVT